MAAGVVEHHSLRRPVNEIYQEPVRLDMIFPLPRVIAVQGMGMVLGKQRFFSHQEVHYFTKPDHILAAFFHQRAIFFEGAGKCGGQHGLLFQVFPHFIKGSVPFGGYLPPQHGVALFHVGDGLGVKTWLPGYRVPVFGAEGTLPLCIKAVFGGFPLFGTFSLR